MKTVAFFNNKGGVGKTTLVYHLAWMVSRMGRTVVVADLDPQANLTSMFLSEPVLEEIWGGEGVGRTIMQALSPMIRGIGDIAPAPVQALSETLTLIPGDLALAQFEGELSEAWGKCLDGREPAFRTTSAFHRTLQATAQSVAADLVLVDMGSNLGAINRASLICADALVLPLAPDLFSLQGLRNLGPTLRRWRTEWTARRSQGATLDLSLPEGLLQTLGYVIVQFGLRDGGMVRAYERWAKRIPMVYREKILDLPAVAEDDQNDDENLIAALKPYRSLLPMAMEARKPIFDLRAADGAIGAHTYSVQSAADDFRTLATRILQRLGCENAREE